MKHLEDKRLCPHCGGELHEKPYLMARTTDGPIPPERIRFAVCVITFLVVFGLLSLQAG